MILRSEESFLRRKRFYYASQRFCHFLSDLGIVIREVAPNHALACRFLMILRSEEMFFKTKKILLCQSTFLQLSERPRNRDSRGRSKPCSSLSFSTWGKYFFLFSGSEVKRVYAIARSKKIQESVFVRDSRGRSKPCSSLSFFNNFKEMKIEN